MDFAMPDFEDRYYGQLEAALSRIEKKVDNGFSEVHKRQDIANGKLKRHDAEIEQIKKDGKSRPFIWYKDKRITTMLAFMGVLFMLIMLYIAGGKLPKWLV